MKTKTKMIISLSIVGAIVVGALITLVAVIASFNATSNSNLKISYTAQNVEAEVSLGYYVIADTDSINPNGLTYTTIKAGAEDKLTFSSRDVSESVSKAFDDIEAIELTKNGYLYLKYTFKHTGNETNSYKYLNVSLNHTFTENTNMKIQYALYNPTMTDSTFDWMAGLNGLTITRDIDNECVLFARIFVDVKSQDALLKGEFAWSMSSSDTEYYANMVQGTVASDAPNVVFDYNTEENLAKVSGVTPTSLSADGSGPIDKYVLDSGEVYVLSDSEIFATSCYRMFKDDPESTDINSVSANSIEGVTFNNINTKYVTNMSQMFYGADLLTSIDLKALETSEVKSFSAMFLRCTSLETLDLSTFKTDNVTTMSAMFWHCEGLTNLNVSSFNTEKTTIFNSMFSACFSLVTLDLTSFNTMNVIDVNYMFSNSSKLTTIYAIDWNSSNFKFQTGTFISCNSLIGGNGTTYNSSYTDATYARIDTEETPGYFTLKTT